MHSIERYGIVALLFLVVTVIAVLMWDGNRAKKEEPATAAHTPAGRAGTEALRADSDAGRRLSLLADSQPGPLQRHPRGARARANAAQDAAGTTPPTAGAPLAGEHGGQDELDAFGDEFQSFTDGEAPQSEVQDPRERPAPEQVIGATEPAATLSAPPAAPLSKPAMHAYTVRAGDTLSEIAQRELGSSRRWQELVAANPGLDPAKLRVGKTIQVPGAKSGTEVARASEPKSAAAAKPRAESSSKATPAGGKTWKVGKGENLWRIAERALGDGKRWGEIAKLNPKVNPDRLVLGQVLVLPGTASAQSSPSKAGKSPSGTKVASTPPKSKDAPVLLASSDRPARRGGKVK